jgi:hypothetical protein
MIIMKMKNYVKLLSAPLLFCLLATAIGCTDDNNMTSDEEEKEEENDTTMVVADNDMNVLISKFYSDDLSVIVGDDIITITTAGLPDHVSMYYGTSNSLYEAYDEPDNADFKKNPGSIGEQNIVFKLPRFPEKAITHQSPGGGPMGVSINSVVFFNQQAGPGDDIFEEVNTFDQYEGHPAGDLYHYHIEPVWLTSLKGSDAFLGFLLDGFPVYGPMENGAEITNDDLDIYHGHTSVTADFADGIYHYHVTTEYPWINGDAYYGTPSTKTQ